MDLAKACYTFAKRMYPKAIRIANLFHVNRYVTEALQIIRKSVQKDVAPFAFLKNEMTSYQWKNVRC